MSTQKQNLHKLIDLADDETIGVIYNIVQRVMNRPVKVIADTIYEWDDSPLCEEERKEVKEAEKEIAEGELIDWEDVESEREI